MGKITAQDIINYQNEMSELKAFGFTKQQWCDLGQKIITTHGLTEREAIDILQNNNTLAILAKYQQTDKEGER